MKMVRSLSAVALARIIEQVALIVTALVLAAVADPKGYATAAILLTWLSAAATLADLGTGYQVLRSSDTGLPRGLVRPLLYSASAGVVVAIGGLAGDRSLRTVIFFGGLIWALSSAVQLFRALALRSHREQLVLGSSAASGALLILLTLVLPFDEVGVVAGVGLVCKLGLEALFLLPAVVLNSVDSAPPWTVFASQTLTFAGANLDFFIVGVVLGPAAFSLYVLAFRLSGGLYSVASHVLTRVSTVRLAALTGPARSHHLRRWILPVVGLGLGGTIGLIAVAPVLPRLLGNGWNEAVPLVQILAFLVPFRLLHGLFGAGLLVERVDGVVLKMELGRVAITAIVLIAAAQAGLTFLSVAVVMVAIAATTATAIVLQRSTSLQLVGPIAAIAPTRSGPESAAHERVSTR